MHQLQLGKVKHANLKAENTIQFSPKFVPKKKPNKILQYKKKSHYIYTR